MGISDNARERARIARLKALGSEERVQKYGDLSDSRVTVINYDPDRGYLVRALNGEVGYATNISGTQLGVGATVQATRKGNGFIIDYFDQSSGKGNGSDNNNLSKEAFNNASSSTGFSGFGGIDANTSIIGYKPDGQGGCDVKTYPKDTKLPDGVYATAKECQDSQKTGSFKCVSGKCIEVTDGSGKYKTKAECEAALIPAIFTGGQCVGVSYQVVINVSVVSYYFPSGYTFGPPGAVLTVFGKVNIRTFDVPSSVAGQGANRTWRVETIDDTGNVTAFQDVISAAAVYSDTTTVTITRLDGQPDNCGNPPKQCP